MELLDSDLQKMLSNIVHVDTKNNISLKILKGLRYLHENQIFHSDLKPANVLVSKDFLYVKLVDFGVSVISSHSKITKTNQGGSLHYMAPEQVLNGRISSKSDIYSFGILLHILYSNEIPWNKITSTEIAKKFSNQETPTVENNNIIPDNMKEIIKLCLQFNPSERPSAQDLIEIMKPKKMREMKLN